MLRPWLRSVGMRLLKRLTDALVLDDGDAYVVLEDMGTGISVYRRIKKVEPDGRFDDLVTV